MANTIPGVTITAPIFNDYDHWFGFVSCIGGVNAGNAHGNPCIGRINDTQFYVTGNSGEYRSVYWMVICC